METNIKTLDHPFAFETKIDVIEGKGWLRKKLQRTNDTIFITLDEDGYYISHRLQERKEIVRDVQPEVVPFAIPKTVKSFSPEMTQQILKLFWTGVPISGIAQQLEIDHEKVINFIHRYKAVGKIALTDSQEAQILKMLETCSHAETIAKLLKLPVCMVKGFKQDWIYKTGSDMFGLSQEKTLLIIKRVSARLVSELEKNGYTMPTLAAQVGISREKLSVFLKMIR